MKTMISLNNLCTVIFIIFSQLPLHIIQLCFYMHKCAYTSCILQDSITLSINLDIYISNDLPFGLFIWSKAPADKKGKDFIKSLHINKLCHYILVNTCTDRQQLDICDKTKKLNLQTHKEIERYRRPRCYLKIISHFTVSERSRETSR